jgi:hypothetical protein
LTDVLYSLPLEPETFETGKTGRPLLNPRFSEALMGLPLGWTECEQPVTEWSHWLQASRSRLSELISELDSGSSTPSQAGQVTELQRPKKRKPVPVAS